MGDWVLRAEGVNFNDTIDNTNDLSTIRGASLTLEAFVHELEQVWLKKKSIKYSRIYYGGSQIAFLIENTNEQAIDELCQGAREFLSMQRPYDSNWPPYFDYNKNSLYPPDKPEDTLYLKPPTEHMRFVVEGAQVENGDIKAALNKALWQSRRRQMATPNLPNAPGVTAASSSASDRAAVRCPIDLVQTIERNQGTIIWVAEGQFKDAIKADDKNNTEKVFGIYASKRSANLRAYGRDARRMLYPVQLGQKQVERLVRKGLFRSHDFAQSFHQIVDTPPNGLAESVKGKLAYLYFDGNAFGKIRANNDPGDFSKVLEKVNSYVLNALLNAVFDDGEELPDRMFHTGRVFVRSGKGQEGSIKERALLRLETLLFGGEDFLVVLPAWLGWNFANRLLGWYEEAVDTYAKNICAEDGFNMTHRCGMLICDHKTPVRRARQMAYALCEEAKGAYEDRPESALAFHIIESHDVPEVTGNVQENLRILRENLYSGPGNADAEYVAGAFRCLQRQEPALRKAIVALKSKMARSRLYRLIEELDADPGADFSQKLADYVLKGRTGLSVEDLEKLLTAGKNADTPMRLHLKVIADLWDFVEPFQGGAS